MTITPVGNRLLIRPFRGASKKGSIVIPETARKNQFRAVIISVGEGVKSPHLTPGKIVIYDMYNGLLVDGEKNLFLLVEDDIISTIETDTGETIDNVHITS